MLNMTKYSGVTVLIICIFFGMSPAFTATAINIDKIKNIFKRRPMKSSLNVDVEAQANEILSYNSACDQQLAKAMVILGEQKSAAENALEVCRQHREVAREDIKRLENKVAVAEDNVRENQGEFSRQLGMAQEFADARVAEAEAQIADKEAEKQQLITAHSQEIQALEEKRVSQVEKLKEDLLSKIKEMAQEKDQMSVQLKRDIEQAHNETKEERDKARLNMSALKAANDEHVKNLDDSWNAKLHEAENSAAAKLEKVNNEANEMIYALQSKSSQCVKEFANTKKAHTALQEKYDRAIQEISSWEQVFGQRRYCNFTHILEDATNVAVHAGDRASAKLAPFYDQYLKNTVGKTRDVIGKIIPVIQPLVDKIREGVDVLVAKNREISAAIHARVKVYFVHTTCPRIKVSLRDLRKRKGLYSPAVNESVKKACSEPDEFLSFASTVLRILFLFLFRRMIFRIFTVALLLPFKVFAFPFTFMIRTKTKIAQKRI